MDRRSFLKTTAAVAALAPLGLRAAEPPRRPLKKGLMFSMLRSKAADKLSLHEKFKLVREAGFEGAEVNSGMNQSEVLAARDAAGLAIPSLIIATHWTHPLSDPNPGKRAVTLDALKQGLRDAKAYGASSVLLVPAVVNKDVSYADAYKRSHEEIAKAVPLAEELGVVIAIENVWNKFLLSPLEAAAYVDSFKSKAVGWHFDVGNVIDTGWPEQWIHILGPRIQKIHVKEYSRKLRDEKGPRAGFQAEFFTGDSDWPSVMKALDDIGYHGWLIAEHTYRPADMDDATWLKNTVTNMEKMIAI